MIIHRLYVHLADNEWGSAIMEEIAQHEAKKYQDKENLLITVYEHGGWSLSWLFPQGIIVGSANDMAVFNPEASAWREKAKEATVEYLGSIRREVSSNGNA